LHQTLLVFVTAKVLGTCPRTGQNRTLYSLRRAYSTFALLNDGMDIRARAIRMDTSMGMRERQYSHFASHLKNDMLTGKRFDLPSDQWKSGGSEL
jgi:hypothetical protein